MRPLINSHIQVILLCFLIAKLGLTGIFVCTRAPALSVPILDPVPAFATDSQAKTPAGTAPVSFSNPKQYTSQATDQEDTTTLDALEQKRAQLKAEKRLLQKERERLTELKQEIDAKLSRLTQLQSETQSKLADRIKHLIKILTTMPPKKAAALIDKLHMKVIIAVLSRMKGENVGKILPHVSAEKAAKISERLVKLGL